MSEDPDGTAASEDGTVLSPDELDISDEDNVVELEEGRYVISPGGREPTVPSTSDATSTAPPTDSDESDPTAELTESEVHAWIEERLESADSKYAFDVTANFESRTAQKVLFSNDVVTTFENLVVWYATHAGGDTPVEDVLGILLVESNLSIRFPVDSLMRYADTQGLDGNDPLDALFAAAQESGGICFSAGDD